jgi:hypothetical protein
MWNILSNKYIFSKSNNRQHEYFWIMKVNSTLKLSHDNYRPKHTTEIILDIVTQCSRINSWYFNSSADDWKTLLKQIIMMINREWNKTLRRNELILKFAELAKKNENIWGLCKTGFCIWYLLEAYWIIIWLAHILFSSFFTARLPLMGQGFLTLKAARSHSDILHSVGHHRTSDRTVAETYTWQRTTLTTEIHALRWIRTRNPRKRETAHPHLRPRGRWDRPRAHIELKKKKRVTAKVVGLLFALLEYSTWQFL